MNTKTLALAMLIATALPMAGKAHAGEAGQTIDLEQIRHATKYFYEKGSPRIRLQATVRGTDDQIKQGAQLIRDNLSASTRGDDKRTVVDIVETLRDRLHNLMTKNGTSQQRTLRVTGSNHDSTGTHATFVAADTLKLPSRFSKGQLARREAWLIVADGVQDLKARVLGGRRR